MSDQETDVVREPDRAVAVVVREGRVLVIDRHLRKSAAESCVMCLHADARCDGECPGHDYTVLPGGGVEAGESAREAAQRELWEESTLKASAERLLWSGVHNQRDAYYFEMVDVVGTARLSGDERQAHAPWNSFTLAWSTRSELMDRSLYPPETRDHLLELAQLL